MPRSPAPGLSGRIAGRSRRVAGAVAAVAAVALVIGVVVGAGLPGSSQGANQPAKTSGATIVQRRDLVATDTVSGTLSYARPHTVFNRESGTITSLPAVGQVIKPGQALYQVNGSPVILFDGATPAYRDLTAGVSDGSDVRQLNQNLIRLGFDTSHQITPDSTWQAGTTTALESFQASLGETQTGTVTLGQIVFLPGSQRITAVDSVLGSTGGSGAGGGAAASTTSTGASTRPVTPAPQFVSLTTITAGSGSPAAAKASCPTGSASPSGSLGAGPVSAAPSPPAPADCASSAAKPPASPRPGKPPKPATPGQTLAALIALLRAETLELKSGKSSPSGSTGGSASSGRSAGTSASPSATSGARGSGAASAAGSGAASTGGASSAAGTGSGSATATAAAVLGTTSTQLVVTVALDATKQSEATVGEPVTVQLPNGNTVDGKVTQVSPVAQTTSTTATGSSAAGGGASSTPSATVPITITLNGRRRADVGLDQAAVSVNFQQQVARNVLSVPVTALLATAGGGYSVQAAAPPHQLIPVSTGLFAAGYVQISGSQIAPGLQVTDSQG